MPAARQIPTLYDPCAELEHMGIPVIRTWLRDTWGAWLPQDQAIVIAEGLNAVQERCVLAHELEHVLAGDTLCATIRGVRAELLADRRAARKLLPISEFYRVMQWASDEFQMAEELQVTPWMIRARYADLEGGAQWLGTSKIAG
ncbi:uncharacterized protein DUF955 [Streptomyces sp. TLI_235]|nr:ImmA/IrrE family metallo-endopeptidase [Streptomyces sp. TLI_235]PBC72212.1 uncharacterized protein DUF955 [Streptomyces sp. TLI_235]